MNEVGAGGGSSVEAESNEILRTSPNTIKRSTPTGEYAVRGAVIKCDCGDGIDVVNIPLCHGVYSGEHPLVSVKDMKVRENICNGFGTCITPEGEKYDCKKEICVDHEWINENKVRFHIDGEEVLATGAITMCSKHGGGIRVVESGQNGIYVQQSTDEVNVAEKRNMMNNLGEGADSIKDIPEIPAAILAGLTTIDACEAKIKELGQMWSDADGSPAIQEYYHRQANQIREHILVLGKTAPVSKEYLESVKRQLGSVDGSDSLKASSTVGEDLLGVEVKELDELAKINQENIIREDIQNEKKHEEYLQIARIGQLRPDEKKLFLDTVERHVRWRLMGSFINLTLDVGVISVGVELVWYREERMKDKEEKIFHKFLGDPHSYIPDYNNPFIYLIYGGGVSNSTNLKEVLRKLLDVKNYSKNLTNISKNVSLSVGTITGVESAEHLEEHEYFDEPTDYNGTFYSASVGVGWLKLSHATDPNNICETDSAGFQSPLPSFSAGRSEYILIPQEDSMELVAYLMSNMPKVERDPTFLKL